MTIRAADGQVWTYCHLAYLVPTVQTEAENQQIPNIVPLRPDVKPIMRAFSAGDVSGAAKEQPVAPKKEEEDSIVHLLVRGGLPVLDPAIEQPVHDEVRVAADRRGEVAVILAG